MWRTAIMCKAAFNGCKSFDKSTSPCHKMSPGMLVNKSSGIAPDEIKTTGMLENLQHLGCVAPDEIKTTGRWAGVYFEMERPLSKLKSVPGALCAR